MNVTHEITFNAPPIVIAIAVGALLIVAALAVFAWRRSGYDLATGCLEMLRLLLATLAVLTLCQPEWKEIYQPNERPVLVLIADESASMETRDVIDPADPRAEPSSRLAWLRQQLDNVDWGALDTEVEIVEERFASAVDQADKRQGTDIDAALNDVLKRYKNLRAVALLTDGDWNEGSSPTNSATRLRINNVPVYTVALGSEVPLPDIEVASLEPPTFSVVGKSLQIPFTLRSTMASDYEVDVTLEIETGVTVTKQVVVPAMGDVRDVFFWTPDEIGDVELAVHVPPHESETIRGNNEQSVNVAIKPETLKVLIVESFPRWEYRYLRNALDRDPGVDVSCLLFHPDLSKFGGGAGYIKQFPTTIEELARFDVVMLGDVGVNKGQLTVENCQLLKGLVEKQASGLVFMPGMRGNQYSLLSTDLEDLYPVVLDSTARQGYGSRIPSTFVLTEIGQTSLLTKLADTDRENDAVWRGLPGFQWRSPAVRHKAGSEVLAVHEQSRAPLLVTKTYGTGKILFMGTDGAWRWREGVEDKYHYRFWGQVARWMAYQRHMAEGEMLRMFYTPDRPEPGNVVTLNATVLDPTGVPLNRGTVHAEITDPDGKNQTEIIRFQSKGADWGLYTARFTPNRTGVYQVKLFCKETGAVLDTRLAVHGEQREKVGKPARHDVLREIANVSRGQWIPYDEISTIRDKVLELPPPEPAIRRRQIWASPYWAGALIGILGVFWVGRKMQGAI